MSAPRTVLITGAASGIGLATARRFAAIGDRVVLTDAAADRLQAAEAALATDHPGRVAALRLDVTDEADWAAAGACGPLDVLVHAAGISAGTPLADTPLEEWRRVLRVNLDGAFLALRHGLRAMRAERRAGCIVLVSSASGLRAAPGAAAYSCSKAGVEMLIRAAARECRAAGDGIRVVGIAPGGVRTPLWNSMPFFQQLVREQGSEEAAFAALERSAGDRFADPAEVAAAAAYLASAEAAGITGTTLVLDGGYTA